VFSVRLPRLLVASLVGASLAVAGALLQTAVRNPLADPGLLGVSAGAALAVLGGLLFAPAWPELLPLLGFTGGISAMAVLLLASAGSPGRDHPLRLVLCGVALQSLFFAGVSLLTFVFAERAPAFVGFTLGSLNGVGWREVGLVALPAAVGVGLASLSIRPLDVMLLDEQSASGVGLAVRRARIAVACIAALLAAGAVSVAGLVGFVGLVVPNAVRLVVGPGHRALVPLAALGGGAFVVLADTAARTWLSPIELPVGVPLACVGAPYFLYLVWKARA
jgi:iron complex transport system permease protein